MSPRYPSETIDPSPLAAPLTFPFSGATAPNRLLKAAMSEGMSSYSPENHAKHGIPSAALAHMYERWAVDGGYGQILTGNVMLFDDQLEAPGNMIIPLDAEPKAGDERFEAFKAIAEAGKKGGGLIVAQISHPGRQVDDSVNKSPIGASDVPLSGPKMGRSFAAPRAATIPELQEITAAFAHAASYLSTAGFSGAALHGAHGYLLAQFFSKTTNTRTDAYGGSITNRARLATEIAAAIRAATPPGFVLGIKMNSVEFQEHGLQADEAAELVRCLEGAGFDYVELSGGTYEVMGFKYARESSEKREGFFMEFAPLISAALTKTKVYVTGGFKTVAGMVKALDTVDGVGLGRPVCHEFGFGKDILEGKVTGAIVQRLDETDFLATAMAGMGNMRRVAEGLEPEDYSDEGVVGRYLEMLRVMMGGAAAEKGPEKGSEEVEAKA